MGGQAHSKFQTFPATCKEFVHPYCDSCFTASAGLFIAAIQQSLRIYITAYSLAFLFKARKPSAEDLRRTLLGILQSTFFLTCHAFGFSAVVCAIRNMTGSFNFFTAAYVPCFIASLGAILVERPSRRSMLSLYVTNVASETVFNMLVSRSYFRPIPMGEIIIFASSMATLLYFYKSEQSNSNDMIYSILRFFVGKHEKLGCEKESISDEIFIKPPSFLSTLSPIQAITLQLRKLQDNLKLNSSDVCTHPDGCAAYALKGGGKMFSLGFLIKFCLKLLNIKQILKKPTKLLTSLVDFSTYELSCFLGGFSSLYRAISCLLRRLYQKDSQYFAIPAGLVAGLSFYFFRDNTIALYVFWKTMQTLYNNASEKGHVPELKHANVFFHCFSTAILFHAAIFEPKNLRPSYWKFLQGVSGGRLAGMERDYIERYGANSQESLRYMLNKYKSSNIPINNFGM